VREEILKGISDCIVSSDLDRIGNLVKEALRNGVPAYEVVLSGMVKGIEIVGQKFQANEYFLSELTMAGEVLKKGMAELEPHLKMEGAKSAGKVVIGQGKGTFHDVGRKIVINLLTGAGFEVYDLGIDVSEDRFVEKVKEENADIVAVSVLLTGAVAETKTVVEALEKAGLREKVKVIIGRRGASDELAREFGADAATKDALDGVRICQKWVRVRQRFGS